MTGRRRVCGLHWPTGSDRLTDLPSLNLNGVKWTAATPTRRPVDPEVAERTRQQLEAATEEQRRAAVEAKLVVKLAAERKAQAELEEAQLAFFSSPAGAAFREEQNRLRFRVAQLEASLTQNLDAVRLAKKRKIVLRCSFGLQQELCHLSHYYFLQTNIDLSVVFNPVNPPEMQQLDDATLSHLTTCRNWKQFFGVCEIVESYISRMPEDQRPRLPRKCTFYTLIGAVLMRSRRNFKFPTLQVLFELHRETLRKYMHDYGWLEIVSKAMYQDQVILSRVECEKKKKKHICRLRKGASWCRGFVGLHVHLHPEEQRDELPGTFSCC